MISLLCYSWFIVLVLRLNLCMPAAAVSYSLPPAQYDALYGLYNATNGLQWTWKEPYSTYGYPWTFSGSGQSNPCSEITPWQGINCTSDCVNLPCYVTNVTLTHNEMSGTFPPSFANLNNSLEYIRIGRNPKLIGTIPSWFESFSSLWFFDLHGTGLTGTLPDWLGNMVNVEYLILIHNQLTGTIPSSIGNMSSLRHLNIDRNQLTGTLPPSLGNLTELQSLLCIKNDITGTLPSSLGNLINLQIMMIYLTQITGSIPESFATLPLLKYLFLGKNSLSGTIPTMFVHSPSLLFLDLDSNQFTSTIPAEYGSNTSNIHTFAIDRNLLTGTIPPVLGNATALTKLFLYVNYLTGTIPSELSQLPNLQYMILFDNCLTGYLSPMLGNLTTLMYMDLHLNMLSGSLPSEWGNMTALFYMDLDSNLLTGSIPASFSAMQSMETIYLYNNTLTGTIPSELGDLPFLRYISLQENLLTGSFPSALCDGVHALEYIYLQDNYLTSTLPSCLNNFRNLTVLSVSNNSISGSLPSMQFSLLHALDLAFNAFSGTLASDIGSASPKLVTINLNNNAFTGSLPSSLFSSQFLTSVVLGSNCFTGTISDMLCSSGFLTQLILDGLHSSPSCTKRAFPFIPHSGVILNDGVHGTIPDCLFQMQNLSVLHLGGNAFSGTIPNVPLSPSLDELVLSNNAFTGTIPDGIWYSSLTTLDASYNRFQGRIPDDLLPVAFSSPNADANVTVKLQVNQLSGTVPSSLVHLSKNDIDVLEGNMFSCNIERTNIPKNDPKYNGYFCGSDSTNAALVVFGCVVMVLILCLFLVPKLKHAFRTWIVAYHHHLNPQMDAVLSRLQSLIRSIVVVGVVGASILFGVLSIFFSSYSDTYIWIISAIYTEGLASAICLLGWFVFVTCLIVWIFIRSEKQFFNFEKNKNESMSKLEKMKRSWSTLAAILFNIVFVTFVNGLYVSAVRSDFSSEALTGIALSLSVFKYVWSTLLLKGGTLLLDTNIETLVCLSLFNNLAAPFLAEMFVSADCFLNVLSQAPSLLFTYSEYRCYVDVVIATAIITIQRVACDKENGYGTLNVIPPFHYSHQCSFALMSSYTSVIIYRYILSGMVVPFIIWTLRASSSWVTHKVASEFLPVLWRVSAMRDAVLEANIDHLKEEIDKMEKYTKTFLRQQFIINFSTDISMLICFGAVFPPMALVIAVSIWKDISDIRLALGRFNLIMERVTDEGVKVRMLHLKALINNEYIAGGRKVFKGVILGLCLSCGLWALVLFDTLSATEGNINSIWIVIVMLMSPYVVFGILWTFNEYYYEKNRDDSDDMDNDDVEVVVNPLSKKNLNIATGRKSEVELSSTRDSYTGSDTF